MATTRKLLYAGGLLLLNGATLVHAQSGKVRMPYVIGAYAQGSFIMAHTPAVRHLAVSHPTGFEINVQRQTTGTAPWHAWYRYPKIGVALIYYDYHNPQLGQSYAGSVYINKPIWRTNRQEISFRLGTGLAYFPTRYNLEDNRKNLMIGSRLNATLQARLEYDVALTEHWGILFGVGLNHYSNGATSKPNRGINLPSVVLGVNYHQHRSFKPSLPIVAPTPVDSSRYFLNVGASYSFKQRSDQDRRKYTVYAANMAVGRRLNRKSNLVLGIDGFHDQSLAVARGSAPDSAAGSKTRVGLYLGHELLFGRLAFVTHIAGYIYDPTKVDKPYYERIGVKYHLTNRLFGEVALKVHGASADVIEWRAGLRF